jgi:hypothetical protein
MTTLRQLPAAFPVLLVFCIGQDVHGENPGDRSFRQGTQPVMVAFANQTPDPVTALWIDFDGLAREVGTIPPGQIVELATFPGHLTLFSSGGLQLSSFRASASSHGSAFGIVGPGGSIDPSKPKIAVCWAPPPGMTGPSGGNSPQSPGTNPVTQNDIASIIRLILQNL